MQPILPACRCRHHMGMKTAWIGLGALGVVAIATVVFSFAQTMSRLYGLHELPQAAAPAGSTQAAKATAPAAVPATATGRGAGASPSTPAPAAVTPVDSASVARAATGNTDAAATPAAPTATAPAPSTRVATPVTTQAPAAVSVARPTTTPRPATVASVAEPATLLSADERRAAQCNSLRAYLAELDRQSVGADAPRLSTIDEQRAVTRSRRTELGC
jgi:hypothetical protein